MSTEELKNRLLEAEAEGADRAGIYDEVVSEFSSVQEELTSANTKVEDLTNRVGQLTDTNYKLLEKVRYIDGAKEEDEPESEEVEEMTIEKLFEME